MKTGHVKTDPAHFRVHFRDNCRLCREHSRGSLGSVEFDRESLNLRGHFRVHFPERFRDAQFVHKILVHNFGAPLTPPPPYTNQQSDGFLPLEFR